MSFGTNEAGRAAGAGHRPQGRLSDREHERARERRKDHISAVVASVLLLAVVAGGIFWAFS